MTRDEILNRIALQKHGRHFNEIFAMKSRAEILQQALDEVLEQVKDIAYEPVLSDSVCYYRPCLDQYKGKCTCGRAWKTCTNRQTDR